MIILNEFKVDILKSLKETKSINRITAKTIYELFEIMNCEKLTTLRKNINELTEVGYVNLGLPDARSKSYYITGNGMQYLELISKKSYEGNEVKNNVV